jgi:6-phosphogluconolactonase
MLESVVSAGERMKIYFGTYTGGPSKGIYVAEFDTTSGVLRDLKLVGETENPSFLAIHPQKRALYSVSEVRADGGRRGAALVAWKIDPQSAELTEIGRVATESDGPCHVSIDGLGRYAAVANYSGGSVTLASLDAQGVPSAPHTLKHHGSSRVNPQRQEAPHAHCVRFSPRGDLLLVSDLGLDQILIYQLASGSLTPAAQPFISTAPGAGPRHIRFTPDGKWLLVINELANTISSYRFDATSGKLAEGHSAVTLPKEYHGSNSTAEICVHPNGRWVYGSNRGHDSIAIFELDGDSGSLRSSGIEPARVKTPRNFNLIGDNWLIAVGQDSNTASVFKVDSKSGRLAPHGPLFEVPKAVCVLPVE